ncbi:MAG: hypothetical protein A2Y76_06290 [Planctomycetes bacterium RBG_13_60_9]|nr:MAG: hypothetical protein A2Y76_06290 [Planctomycetes bacterium RBG_13_60_9]
MWAAILIVSFALCGAALAGQIKWRHLSSVNGDLPAPNSGNQQTASLVCDIDKDGRPEVVLVVGDGWAPLMMYQWQRGTWIATELIPEVDCGHSLALVDFNKDGNLDIWVAEMRLNDGNPDAKNMLLLGDGKGRFETIVISEGIANHESKIADLDGDGDYDILDKPYSWQTPRLDIWLNTGTE